MVSGMTSPLACIVDNSEQIFFISTKWPYILLCSSKTYNSSHFYFPRKRALPPPQPPTNFVIKVVTGVDGRKRNWQHSMAHPRKHPYRRKNFAKIFYASRVIANFVLNFVAMATGVSQGIMQLSAFDGPSPKTPLQAQKSRKNLLRKPSYSQFCPKFRCHGNGGQSGENAIVGVRWHIPENPL